MSCNQSQLLNEFLCCCFRLPVQSKRMPGPAETRGIRLHYFSLLSLKEINRNFLGMCEICNEGHVQVVDGEMMCYMASLIVVTLVLIPLEPE